MVGNDRLTTSARLVRDSSGAFWGVVLIFRDVTERYAAEEKLRVSEAALPVVRSRTPTSR